MIVLVKELKALMKEKHLSPERASHFIGSSTNSVVRWLNNTNPPSQMYRRMIEEGISRIKEAYPKIEKKWPRVQILSNLCVDNLNKMPEKEKDFWELVISKMTAKETKAVYWIGMNKKDMEKQILKIAKRLNISN